MRDFAKNEQWVRNLEAKQIAEAAAVPFYFYSNGIRYTCNFEFVVGMCLQMFVLICQFVNNSPLTDSLQTQVTTWVLRRVQITKQVGIIDAVLAVPISQRTTRNFFSTFLQCHISLRRICMEMAKTPSGMKALKDAGLHGLHPFLNNDITTPLKDRGLEEYTPNAPDNLHNLKGAASAILNIERGQKSWSETTFLLNLSQHVKRSGIFIFYFV